MSQFCVDPKDIGLDYIFPEWRRDQPDAIQRIMDSTKRYVLLSMPTGSGKSGVYIAASILTARRFNILTFTKGLQDQLMKDFRRVGLVDIRGRNNYPCHMPLTHTPTTPTPGQDADEEDLESQPYISCEEGGMARCPDRRSEDCPYFAAYKEFLRSELGNTNFSYFTRSNYYTEGGLGNCNTLVLDEAHEAPDQVCSAVALSVTSKDVYARLNSDYPKNPTEIASWAPWAMENKGRALSALEMAKTYAERGSATAAREAARCQSLVGVLEELATLSGEWIVEATNRRAGGYVFNPVWAKTYAHRVLFSRAERVVLLSATLTPYTAELLGIKPDEYEFIEYPSAFPTARSPIYCVNRGKITNKTMGDPENVQAWIELIDEIIESRMHNKGIIHCVSYEYKNLIKSKSKYGKYMIDHRRGSEHAMKAVADFKASSAPSILLSPAMTTGYDFPHDTCRWQIITKMPWPDTRSAIMTKRCATDQPYMSAAAKEGRKYAAYVMWMDVVQAAGRGMRAKDDWCETFIIDGKVKDYYHSYISLIPAWFRNLLRWRTDIPKPVF